MICKTMVESSKSLLSNYSEFRYFDIKRSLNRVLLLFSKPYVELFNGRSSSNLVTAILPTVRRAVLPPTPDIVTYEFDWTGQIAGFRVEGEFSYDLSQSYEDGIVREENLESFDISFFAPDGS